MNFAPTRLLLHFLRRLNTHTIFFCFCGLIAVVSFARSHEVRALSNEVASVGISKSKFELRLKRGKELLEANQLENARIEFDAAIRIEPEEKAGYDYRGCLAFVMGEYDQAISDLTKVVKLDPSDFRAILNRANAYQSKGDHRHAAEDLNKYLDSVHTNDIAFKTRASTFISLGCFAQAVDDCNSSLKIVPNDAKCLVMRGCAQARLGRFDLALADFFDSALADPDAAEAYNQISWLRGTCSDKSYRNAKSAVEFGTKACELSRWSNGRYLDTLAAAKAESGDFIAAIDYQKLALSAQNIGEAERNEMQSRLTKYLNGQPFHEVELRISVPRIAPGGPTNTPNEDDF